VGGRLTLDDHASPKGKAPGAGRFNALEGVLPIDPSRVPTDIVAGVTLAALAIPEVMGYTSISGTPIVTGLYTILLPIAVFALLGSSRHLVVGADSATAAILAAGRATLATPESPSYVALAALADHVRRELDRSGVTEIVGKDAYFDGLEEVRKESQG